MSVLAVGAFPGGRRRLLRLGKTVASRKVLVRNRSGGGRRYFLEM